MSNNEATRESPEAGNKPEQLKDSQGSCQNINNFCSTEYKESLAQTLINTNGLSTSIIRNFLQLYTKNSLCYPGKSLNGKNTNDEIKVVHRQMPLKKPN